MCAKYRPIFHMLPHSFWMNDPNGPIYKDGLYHLFYQHNPEAPVWGNIHWGHAVSRDLVRWEQRPIALYPSYDKGELHCFSGSCIIRKDGTPLILYTSVGDGDRNPHTGSQQWAALGSQDLNEWEKVPENPVMDASVHSDLQILEWRDPYMFTHGQHTFAVIGGSWEGRGCALLYRAENDELLEWKYIGFLSADESGHDIWECPNLFYLEGKYVFIYSPISSMQYEIGSFDGREFVPETGGTVDFGGWQGLYAANTCRMADGRVVMFCWMPEALRSELEEDSSFEWAGVQAIPRILQISEENELLMYPVESIASLRKFDEAVHVHDTEVEGRMQMPLHGKALDLYWKIELDIDTDHVSDPDDCWFKIEVLADADDREKTVLLFYPLKQLVKIDKTHSSIYPQRFSNELTGTWTPAAGGTVEIRLFVDFSTVELFVDNRVSISTRVYPHYESSGSVFTETSAADAGLRCTIREFTGYPMRARDLLRGS